MTVEPMTGCRGHAVELECTDGVLHGFSTIPRKQRAIARAMRRRSDWDEQHRDGHRRYAKQPTPGYAQSFHEYHYLRKVRPVFDLEIAVPGVFWIRY